MNPIMSPMMDPTKIPFSGNDKICDCQGPTIHKVPRMPIMIDQVKADPMDVRDLRGKPLHTIVDDDALENKMLQLFTSQEAAQGYARSIPSHQTGRRSFAQPAQEQTATARAALTAGIPPDTGYIELYEHIDFGGCFWRLLEYNNHTAGDYSTLWACGFLWWGWKNANNTVTSLDIKVSADWVTFFDLTNINFSGSTIWFPGDSWVPNLVPFGWNDRFSSHLLWYFA